METDKSIFARRSIREYKDFDIPDNLLRKILSAGLCAPSQKKK